MRENAHMVFTLKKGGVRMADPRLGGAAKVPAAADAKK